MKKKSLIITIVSVVVLIILIVVILLLCNGGSKKEINVIKAGDFHEGLKIDNNILTNYEDYNNIFNSNDLNEESFKDNNYLIIEIAYDSCSDGDLKVEDYEIKDNKIVVLVSYEAQCGVCAPNYLYYLLPIDKNIEELETKIDYKARNNPNCPRDVAYKPIIYLYPETDTEVEVKLGNSNYLTVSYPKYNDSWKVFAKTNGDLYDLNTNRYYYGLYWEGINHKAEIKEDGFVVKKEDTLKFLEEKLSILGLTEREADEFIIYWLPKLEENNYNYIRFETLEEINNYMPLEINPVPDTIIRVLMDYKGLDDPIEVKEQVLETPKREGFTLVEWGGSIIY